MLRTLDPDKMIHREESRPAVESIDHEMDGKLDRFLDATGELTDKKIGDGGVGEIEEIKAAEDLPLVEKLKTGIEKYEELEGKIDEIKERKGPAVDEKYVGGTTMNMRRQLMSAADSMKEKGDLPRMQQELLDIKEGLGQEMTRLIEESAHNPKEAEEVFNIIESNVESDSLKHFLLNYHTRLHFAHNIFRKKTKPLSVGEIIPPTPQENIQKVAPQVIEKPQNENPEGPKGFVVMAEIGQDGSVNNSLAGQDTTRGGEARIREIQDQIRKNGGTVAPEGKVPGNIETANLTPAEVINESAVPMPVENKIAPPKPEAAGDSVTENQEKDISGEAGVVPVTVNRTTAPEINAQPVAQKRPGFFARLFGGGKKNPDIEAHNAATMHEEVASSRPRPEETTKDIG